MNPKLVFWVPAALRTAIILAGCATLGWMFGWINGLVLALLAMMVMVFVQLTYLYQLSNWMDDPQSAKLPDGWGAWTNIFSRLYRMRRDDEKNQAELTEWLARFRQAMHLLPDGVVIMDDVLFLEWCNPAAEKHLGLTHERDKGMRVTNLVRSPDFMDYIILGRYEQPLTISFRERKLIVHIIPFENRRQILVTHDATETERIEEMRRDFIANASHELRTPLTVIVGFLEIAASEGLDAATRSAHLKLMTEQGHRMQHLIEDMLTLSRLESVDYPMRPEQVDVPKLMEQVLRDARALSAGKHEITMSVNGPDVMGSYEELHSAFGNLASNAVRYTPAGGKIHLVWREFEGGVKFLVEDTGIGISPEHISRLTERFYRVDKSRSRETQGTGLGLAIVKHVLLRHGSTLQIRSEAGKGSTFIVCLPKTAIVHAQPELLLN
ncbi:phosphate regulon sensor histidine kinase PhoR [Duganella sp. BJB488]|uniref:Phosphate regulon sensor protein PhoR n=1 Tax=Duganella vulcania TaxID=2692166 RepID=A0A845GWQ4_9BURK|nr:MULTISPECIES: phosphate regulon sensor histidine kinase PhoR [Duganella]MYM98315.1 phosphate regulon sensor histidine kinase PhoR [Duganella vulcania]NVD74656.1 phosphate regulon sensor histidine kinase PhoR [Duganella sp. BJB1802]RFP15331.1 phosphate regulon sensor histidine kinase PhoR [Duganella sp. BJB489]RFP19887.1 phosphate regulon sensor histidine kinase PhoR [Duganella sp. BJB488]RFP38275.1 phosphate regulon sensor histidine kinase PhoR [Duganella sp. BJB480]